MQKIVLILLVGIIVLGGWWYFVYTKKQPADVPPLTTPLPTATRTTIEKERPQAPQQQAVPLSIKSTVFSANGDIPAKYTCDGRNISPELVFENIPAGTQSLALTMEDPDVPRTVRADGTWNHWIVWNMPSNATGIGEGETPPGIVGKGTNGKASYLGPCPPDREHRYFFTLYALNAMLSLPQSATKEKLLEAIAPHIIEKATLVGRYDRR